MARRRRHNPTISTPVAKVAGLAVTVLLVMEAVRRARVAATTPHPVMPASPPPVSTGANAGQTIPGKTLSLDRETIMSLDSGLQNGPITNYITNAKGETNYITNRNVLGETNYITNAYVTNVLGETNVPYRNAYVSGETNVPGKVGYGKY